MIFTCGNKHKKREFSIGGLSLDVNVGDLQALTLSEKIEANCDTCNKTESCYRKTTVKPPGVLVIHFKRFDANVKINSSEGNIPFELDLCPIASEDTDAKMCDYSLYALVAHSASTNKGHYVAYVQHDKCWYMCDDEHTRKVTSIPQDSVYMLFYACKAL